MINVTALKKAMKQQAKQTIWWQVDKSEGDRHVIGGRHMMVILDDHELTGPIISALADVGLIKPNMALTGGREIELPTAVRQLVQQVANTSSALTAVDTKLDYLWAAKTPTRILAVPGKEWVFVNRMYFDIFPASTDWRCQGGGGLVYIRDRAIIAPISVQPEVEVFTYLKEMKR